MKFNELSHQCFEFDVRRFVRISIANFERFVNSLWHLSVSQGQFVHTTISVISSHTHFFSICLYACHEFDTLWRSNFANEWPHDSAQ